MTHQNPRLWPGVALAVLLLLVRFGAPLFGPETAIFSALAAFALALVILLWLLFFSRIPWLSRLLAIAMLIAALVVTRPFLHPSIAGGMMGMMFYGFAGPFMAVALVVWVAMARKLAAWPRFALLVLLLLAISGFSTLLRTSGVTGEGNPQLAWRWTPDSEEKLLASAAAEPAPEPVPAPAAEAAPAAAVPAVAAKTAAVPPAKPADWPGFRGPHRDSVVMGTNIVADWSASPPTELWRHGVGPGWSSFAIDDGLLYTQEQRGGSEMVSCYRLRDGKPVWTHRDPVRFWESNAGAGPRATPTVSAKRVYAQGATGVLNALDARTGSVIWSRNAVKDTGAKVPDWGIAGSPLVADDLVIVAASGRLAAYDSATGDPRWQWKEKGSSYSSPHLATINGVQQVLMLNDAGAVSVQPRDGKVLWKHDWPGAIILQPAVSSDGAVYVATGGASGGLGIRRLALTPGASNPKEVWTSTGLKPYFNDFVLHKGNAYGFDGSILSCIGLDDGQRKWKGGRYGHGQMLLLADQDLLLILSEEGEIALVSAKPDEFHEISRFKVMDAKTWNHPVLLRDTLIVRNGEEMVALRLAVAGM